MNKLERRELKRQAGNWPTAMLSIDHRDYFQSLKKFLAKLDGRMSVIESGAE